MSDKIKPHHLARTAILYIRQSSAYQVTHNLESQRLQYAMQDRLHQLGWREIDVVDEDLGRSAAGLVTRAGFERMVRPRRQEHSIERNRAGVGCCRSCEAKSEMSVKVSVRDTLLKEGR
jgi:hypothetical protein